METFAEVTAGLALLATAAVIYFLPIVVAMRRQVRAQGSILVVNLLLGWTLVGWVVAMAMAMGPVDRPQQQPWRPPDPTTRRG